MKTKMYRLYFQDKTPVNLIAPEGILFPTQLVDCFGSFCGAGKGIGDLVVPETAYGLSLSAACFIHDEMWSIAERTWADFHYSNSVFLSNIISIIEAGSKSKILKRLRLYRAVTYYNAVDSIGQKIFFKAAV